MVVTVLAVAVGLAFLWSTLLFLTAIFVRARRQEMGFGYSLVGAAIYYAIYADRLPGRPLGLRDPIDGLLPGVREEHLSAASSLVALCLLAVVYVFRVAVFYRLFLKDDTDVDLDGDGVKDDINDYVAPALSYVCFAICMVALVRLAYRPGTAGTLVVVLLLALVYFLPVIRKLWEYLGDLSTALVVVATRLWRGLGRLVLLLIVAIADIELRRRGATTPGRLHAWADRRLRELDAEARAARERERELLLKTGKRARGARATTGGGA